jgi:hypothetical protein
MHEGEFGLSRFGSEPTINAIGNVEANATLRVKVEIVQRKQLNVCGDCISPILDVIGRESQLPRMPFLESWQQFTAGNVLARPGL